MKGCIMLKIYLVWERENIGEHAVIMVTENEGIAKKLTGENKPCKFGEKENINTDRCYEERESEVLYDAVDPG